MIAWRISGICSSTVLPRPAGIGRHVAPAEQHLAFHLDEMLELLDHDFARLGLARQKAHGDGILAGLRQGDAGLSAQSRSSGSGNLNQDAGAIAHRGSAPTAPRWSRLMRS